MSLVDRAAFASLVLLNAFLAMMVALWFYAINHNDGVIEMCIDCMGEGRPEIAVFLLLQAGVFLTCYALATRIRRPAP